MSVRQLEAFAQWLVVNVAALMAMEIRPCQVRPGVSQLGAGRARGAAGWLGGSACCHLSRRLQASPALLVLTHVLPLTPSLPPRPFRPAPHALPLAPYHMYPTPSVLTPYVVPPRPCHIQASYRLLQREGMAAANRMVELESDNPTSHYAVSKVWLAGPERGGCPRWACVFYCQWEGCMDHGLGPQPPCCRGARVRPGDGAQRAQRAQRPLPPSRRC